MPDWYNEAFQRNFVANSIKPNDDDYIVLSDVDEILNFDKWDKIKSQVDKYGIVTCPLYFTMFYFNLFVDNWGGPENYSYRVFVMSGKYFNSLDVSSDELRKCGERKKLIDKIYCMDEICGFHHSWLGDANAVLKKMNAYAHSISEHKGSDIAYIERCIKTGEPFFEGASLSYRPEIKLLPAVERMRSQYPELFWEENKL